MKPDTAFVLLFMLGTWGLEVLLMIDIAWSAARPRRQRRTREVLWDG